MGTELEGSGNSIGYRQMHQRLRIDYGLVFQKETVRVIIKELDPAGYSHYHKSDHEGENTVVKDLTTFGI